MGRTTIGSMEKAYDKQLEDDYVNRAKGRVTRLTSGALKEKIKAFLKNHRICTLATCSQGVPRSTPVRYRSKDFTIYIFTEGGGKVKNILDNPHVSVSLYGTYSGFQSVTGLQLWGKAEIIKPGDGKRYEEAKKIIRMEERADLKKIDLQGMKPMDIIKIKVKRARYLNFPEGILNQEVTIKS
jgi:nitroimidazol reductase NimA-like FMN-containing flavoprotein (pyridoxamine 5'-phosphate oxidase superfamily)